MDTDNQGLRKCADLGRDTDAEQNAGSLPEGELGGLVGVLIEQAKRDEKIIERMKVAVVDGDKDEAFELAKELVGYEE